jgi:lipopolysaccharide export system permease protein
LLYIVLLTRYILWNFLRNLGMLFAALISLYLLIDFFEKIDNFLEKGKSAGLILKFFILNIPFIVEQMSPVCVLLAGVITLGVLNHSNELIALKSCGIPLRKITAPIIAAGMVCILFFLALSQWVLPRTVSVTNEIWNKEVQGRVSLGIYRNGRYYYRGKDGFYSFIRPDPRKNIFYFFSYSTWNEDYELDSILAARGAGWMDNRWNLAQGQEQHKTGTIQYNTEVFRFKWRDFPESPDSFFVPAYRSMELSLLELYQETKNTNSKEESNRAWAEFFGRISYTTLGLPLLLLGLPLLLLVYRKWGRDLSLAIPVSCGMAFLCWGAWVILQSLAKASYMNPLAAAICVHLVVGTAGLILLVREDI